MARAEIKNGGIKILKVTPEDVREVTELLYMTWLATYPNEEHGITTDDIEDRFKDSLCR